MSIFPRVVPKQYLERGNGKQFDIIDSAFENGHVKIALLILSPNSKISEHQHTDDVEYYFNLRDFTLSCCSIGGTHSLENTSDTEELWVISIKIKKFETS